MNTSAGKGIVRTALAFGVSGVWVITGVQTGCSPADVAPEPTPTAPSPAVADSTGTVGVKLTLPGGEPIDTVNWSIQGPNGASSVVLTGTVNVINSPAASFVVGGVPAGSGYTMSLVAQSPDGQVTCTGAAQFAMTARATTNLSVAMLCSAAAPEAGAAFVRAAGFNCATWNSVAASPSEATIGSSMSVVASASGGAPGSLTYAWSAPSGAFDHPNAAQANFTCTAPGPVSLTVTVTDGAVPEGGSCNASAATTTIQVQCDGHIDAASQLATATKIKHLVVIFNENISYDHYFGTYPVAQNNAGETVFAAAPGTPVPNNLSAPLDPTHGFTPVTGAALLTNNPTSLNALNGAGAVNPFRLASGQAGTADQGHNYKPEQQASDNSAMDLFPLYTGTAGPPPGTPDAGLTKGLVMAYFDGNTLGTYWGYAQSYAMNDNSWTTTFGPSTPGAINLIAGQTNGFLATNRSPTLMSTSHVTPDGNGGWTLIGDTDPLGDMCSTAADQNSFVGQNVGNLLNAKGISWGWFEGGFDLTLTDSYALPDGGVVQTTGCARSVQSTVPGTTNSTDYIPHHSPFQYYPSTANYTHARPSSDAVVGSSYKADGVTPEPANHNYDSHDFFDALNAGNLPAVVYLKAPAYQDGHPGYSDPIDEQAFAASVVNALQAAQEWSTTAVVIAYDDSDGWYDHQAPPIVNPSTGVADYLNGTGLCYSGAQQNGVVLTATSTPLLGAPPADGGAPLPALGRCGYGTRVPLMVISPFAKHNYVDHTLTDQTSILKFIEDNWLSGQRIQAGGSFDTIANPITNMLQGI